MDIDKSRDVILRQMVRDLALLKRYGKKTSQVLCPLELITQLNQTLRSPTLLSTMSRGLKSSIIYKAL